ncbi:hypothetical protein VAWG002_18470 [Aeromonas veronii]|nr:hypothetical protein VAWG002_18470 [Aeromonas veronii]
MSSSDNGILLSFQQVGKNASYTDFFTLSHVRAYCEKKREYLDFVMSRFRGEPDRLDASPHGREQDLEWNTHAVVIPHPGLSEGQQAIIVRDNAMTGNQLLINQRIPLMHYALERM